MTTSVSNQGSLRFSGTKVAQIRKLPTNPNLRPKKFDANVDGPTDPIFKYTNWKKTPESTMKPTKQMAESYYDYESMRTVVLAIAAIGTAYAAYRIYTD